MSINKPYGLILGEPIKTNYHTDEVKGRIRIRKKDTNGNIIFDKVLNATFKNNTIYYGELIHYNSGESLAIGMFQANDPEKMKQYLLKNDKEINPSLYTSL